MAKRRTKMAARRAARKQAKLDGIEKPSGNSKYGRKRAGQQMYGPVSIPPARDFRVGICRVGKAPYFDCQCQHHIALRKRAA